MQVRTVLRTLIVAVVLLAGVPCRVSAIGTDTTLAARTADLIANFKRRLWNPESAIPPAVSVAIGRNGTLLFADGFGDAGPGRAATARTIYMVGSITKEFTAAALLRMMEKGATIRGRSEKLELTTPVSEILNVADGWRFADGPPITIGNLLSMTSNLPNYTRRPPHALDPWGAVPARRLLTDLKDYRPSGYPGSFEYSNTSYFLLSEIMEDLSVGGIARRYQQIVRDEVFSRLGLHDTGFGNDTQIAKSIATPHYQRRPRFFQPDWLKGCGDVASTVVDIYKWDKALMDGQALSLKMRDIMLADAARVDVWTYYGAGWFITHKDGIDRYFHSGTVSGYTSFNLIVRNSAKDWISVSLLTNSDGVEDLDTLADQISRLVFNP